MDRVLTLNPVKPSAKDVMGTTWTQPYSESGHGEQYYSGPDSQPCTACDGVGYRYHVVEIE